VGFLSTLVGALGGVGPAIGQAVAYLFSLIVSVFKLLYTIITQFLQYVLRVFKNVGSFFSHLWDNFFKKIFVGLFHAVSKLHDWLEAHLGPVLEWLKKAQKYLLSIYNKYFKPILALIQHIRQFLTILRALHIKWAQQLDHILATIQTDINAAFMKVYGTLNLIIDVVNIISDPERLLRHPVLLLSMRRVFLALVRQLTGLPPGYWFPSRKPHAMKGTGPLSLNFVASNASMNPPPSFYFAGDVPVPSLGDVSSFLPVDNTIGDDLDALDFFAIENPNPRTCIDFITCIETQAQELAARGSNG
jgi:hypothetical protein